MLLVAPPPTISKRHVLRVNVSHASTNGPVQFCTPLENLFKFKKNVNKQADVRSLYVKPIARRPSQPIDTSRLFRASPNVASVQCSLSDAMCCTISYAEIFCMISCSVQLYIVTVGREPRTPRDAKFIPPCTYVSDTSLGSQRE